MSTAASDRAAARGLLLAACALPGLVPALPACAQPTADNQGYISLRWMHHRDAQPGLDRIHVDAPALAVQWPLDAHWSLYGQASSDSVSGASPRWHSSVSGASRLSEQRRGGELRLTRQAEPWGWTLGAAVSDERDYHSRALSFTQRWTSEDHNRTVEAAIAATRDRIGSVNNLELDERRQTFESTLALTQVLTPRDIVQITLAHAAGTGFYSDPYKSLDMRPASRHQSSLVARWNHHLSSNGSTLRLSWRAWRDSWAMHAQSLSAEWVFKPTDRVALAPLLRYHTQSAARFYADPVYSFLGAPYPPGYLEAPPRFLTLDPRLSAFGALSIGAKLSVAIGEQWSADVRIERYEQRAAWRIGGPGSPGIAPLAAQVWQLGMTRSF